MSSRRVGREALNYVRYEKKKVHFSMKKEIFVSHISLHLRLEYITLKFQFTVVVFKFLAHGNQFLIRTFSKVNMQIHATRVETNYCIVFKYDRQAYQNSLKKRSA